MSRPPVAALLGAVFIVGYVAVAVTLPDILPRHWVVQAAYFIAAGLGWVIPIRWLMLWGAHKR